MIKNLAQAKLAFFSFTGAIAAAFMFVFSPLSAMAQLFDPGRDSVSTLREAGGEQPIRVVVDNFLRTGLSFLAILAVILIIYGGITYMTAAGNPDGAKKAKTIVTGAVIGLIIILISWGIVALVLGSAPTGDTGVGGA